MKLCLRSAGALLLVLASVLAAVPAAAAASPPSAGEQRLMVQLRDAGVLEALPAGVRGHEPLRLPGTHVLEVAAERTDAVLAALSRHPGVVYAERDAQAHAFDVIPNDPGWTYQWGVAKIDTPAAWELTTGSSATTVAVLDTGVSPHEDLAGALRPGYNAITGSTDVTDVNGHGTAVAGVAAARGDNGRGVAGMCWSCKVLPVKVLGDNASGSHSAIARGIMWATDHGADVINLSLGGPDSTTTLSQAVDYARARGVVVVAAAGNGFTTAKNYPAAYPTVIGVAASRSDDGRAGYSSYGGWVDVAAPECTLTTLASGGYDEDCGTSFSAPLVAGVAALAASLTPAATPAAVRDALMSTAVPLTYVASGRVRAAEALQALRPAPSAHAVPISGDWNGDGHSTPGWFDQGRITLRDTNSAGAPDHAYAYGRAGDVPIVGDWDGDGDDTVGVIRDRTWHVKNSLAGGDADVSFVYGRLTAGDRPLAGDWNGNGRDTPGIVREGEWHLRNSLSGGPGEIVFIYGRVLRGDIPLVGDWSGDGRDTPAIVRGGEWHLRLVHAGGAADIVFKYGKSTDTPVVGDWDAAGGDTPGVVRGAMRYLRNSLSGGTADLAFRF